MANRLTTGFGLHRIGALEKVLIAVTFGLLARQFYWCLTGYLNPDEFENLQILWLFERGVWPFRDYIHTHLPIHNLLIWPIYRIHGPTAELPGLVRLYLFPVTLVAVWQLGWIARRLSGHRIAAWLCVIVFLSSPAIGKKLVEIRPDTFATPLWFAAIMAFVRYSEPDGRRQTFHYLSALALGLGLIFSQKGVLLVPILAIGFESQMAHFTRPAVTGRMWRHIIFVSIVAVPVVAVICGMGAIGMVRIEDFEWLFTAGMYHTGNDFFWMLKVRILTNGLLASAVAVVFGFVGVIRARLWRGSKNAETKVGFQVLAFSGLVSLAQFLAQSVWFHHLLILPIGMLSILAARELSRLRRSLMVTAIVVALVFPWLTVHDEEVSVGNLRQMQVDRFRFVLDRVPVDQYVLDVFSGLGTFRPIVHRLLHYRPALIELLDSSGETAAWIDALKTGRVGAVADIEWLRGNASREIVDLVDRDFIPADTMPSILLPYSDLPERTSNGLSTKFTDSP